jgi:hypothetical protein
VNRFPGLTNANSELLSALQWWDLLFRVLLGAFAVGPDAATRRLRLTTLLGQSDVGSAALIAHSIGAPGPV